MAKKEAEPLSGPEAGAWERKREQVRERVYEHMPKPYRGLTAQQEGPIDDLEWQLSELTIGALALCEMGFSTRRAAALLKIDRQVFLDRRRRLRESMNQKQILDRDEVLAGVRFVQRDALAALHEMIVEDRLEPKDLARTVGILTDKVMGLAAWSSRDQLGAEDFLAALTARLPEGAVMELRVERPPRRVVDVTPGADEERGTS